MSHQKPKIIKDYHKINGELKAQIEKVYPNGISAHLIAFTNTKGEIIKALPLETPEKMYMIRMPLVTAYTQAEEEDILLTGNDEVGVV